MRLLAGLAARSRLPNILHKQRVAPLPLVRLQPSLTSGSPRSSYPRQSFGSIVGVKAPQQPAAMSSVAQSSSPQDAKPTSVPEVPSGMESETSLLDAFAEVPTIGKVHVRQGDNQDLWLTVFMNQRNLPGNNARKFAVQVALPAAGAAMSSLPMELPDAQLLAPSPSGGQQLVCKGGGDSASLALQLWQANHLAWELLVPKALHGPLVNDGYFASGVAWRDDELAVAYVAETATKEKTPVWGGPESLKDQAGTKGWRGQATAVEDWGELNTGKRDPAVFILDIQSKQVVKVAPSLPADVSVGQPVWTRDGSGLLVVAWENLPTTNFPELGRKLGVVFCYNRACRIYHVPVSRSEEGTLAAGPATLITGPLSSALSPVFSPDGSRLVFLSHDNTVMTGTHSGTARMYKLPWPQAADGACKPEVVVDIVDRPAVASGSGRSFPGLYATSFADEPFLDNSTLLLTSQWYSQTAVLAINTDTGSVQPVTPVDSSPAASYSLAALAGGAAFVLKVAPDCPPKLLTAKTGSTTGEAWSWQPVPGAESCTPAAVAAKLQDLDFSVMAVTPAVGDTSLVFESVCFYPKARSGPLPTVIAPHGGPHTAVTVGWYMPYAYLAALGYAVLCPNYRGSTGFGQASLQSLPGAIGTNDVSDCMASLQAAVDAGIADPRRVAVVGGSHGGFLTGHLIGQHPDAFRAAVMRNPVCNISLMVGLTDINDWCYVETFGCEDGRKRCSAVPKPQDLQRMFEISPVAHVHKVKVPVTLMLGAKDRRVPPPDGQQYLGALRAAGVPVRLFVFPDDTHALDKPQTEYEQWVNVAAMLKEHLA